MWGVSCVSSCPDALRLKAHHVEAAHRYFALAVQHNFIQGRRTKNVVASCLYIVCRREKTSHLLLDFADVLQTNLYVLGATLLKFLRILHIALPIIDPSLYIHRFAAQLEIGQGGGAHAPSTVSAAALQSTPASPSAASADSSAAFSPSSASSTSPSSSAAPGRASVHVVAMTALRLVARMKRDWLQVGRRPSGICGACLLIACRMHGYRRSQREVLDVVKVCDATLRRRMVEFVQTKSSLLTFSEFEAETEEQHRGSGGLRGPLVDEGEGANPPAFTRLREAEAAATRATQRKAELLAQMEAKKITDEDVGREWEAEVQRLLQSPTFQHIDDKQPIHLHEDATHKAALQSLIRQHLKGEDARALTSDVSESSTERSASPACPPVDGIEEGQRLLASLQAIGAVIAPSSASAGPSAPSDDDGVSALLPVSGVDEAPSGGGGTALASPVSVSDADVEEYLLSEEEVQFKTEMWDEVHAAYIAAQQLKAAQHSNALPLSTAASAAATSAPSSASLHGAVPTSSQSVKVDSSVAVEGRGRGGSASLSTSSASSGVGKKEKLTQSVAFLNVTGAWPPPSSTASASSALPAPPHSRHPVPHPPPSASAPSTSASSAVHPPLPSRRPSSKWEDQLRAPEGDDGEDAEGRGGRRRRTEEGGEGGGRGERRQRRQEKTAGRRGGKGGRGGGGRRGRRGGRGGRGGGGGGRGGGRGAVRRVRPRPLSGAVTSRTSTLHYSI